MWSGTGPGQTTLPTRSGRVGLVSSSCADAAWLPISVNIDGLGWSHLSAGVRLPVGDGMCTHRTGMSRIFSEKVLHHINAAGMMGGVISGGTLK